MCLISGSGDVKITDCEFDGSSAVATGLDVTTSSNVVVKGCTFQNNTTRDIRTSTTRGTYTNNVFKSVKSVEETGAADLNIYALNSPFPAPTVIGAGSISVDNIT